jgi:cell division protein FtsW (lipid II flippase)
LRAASLKFRIYITAGIYSIAFGYIYFSDNYKYKINELQLAWILTVNVLSLSGITVRSFPMKLNSRWIKISFSSNPQSFQILSVEIVNSSMFKLRDFTEVNISKCNAINSSCYINPKF